MSVASTIALPAQPTTGASVYTPLGGDGQTAPLGCYLVNFQIAGDASGGTATLTITADPRYTNLFAWLNPTVSSAAGAGDFLIVVQESGTSGAASPVVVGTFPQIATTVSTTNATFLWYPPPMYYQGLGEAVYITDNVGVGETYIMRAQIYLFDIDAPQITPLPYLQLNVPGVSAPAAI